VAIAQRTLARRQHDIGIRYGRGVLRSHFHEDAAVVRLRARYVEARLRQTLQAVYGQCLIHMDGAAYHKRRHDRPPTAASTVAEIKRRLAEHGAPFCPEDKKHQLLARFLAEYVRRRYVSLVIAERYGHRVLFTPSYDPELVPLRCPGPWSRTASRRTRRGTWPTWATNSSRASNF
jgi:hypothetical protein